MKYDVFFSICQTPAAGIDPTEQTLFANFFDQVKLADELGYETAWLAESHFSSQVQKTHLKPVIPHWEGEIGLNTDIFQLAHIIFNCTSKIEVGSAVANIVCNGGPISAAERVAAFCTLHGLNPDEKRKLNFGFSAGRFDFMNRVTGVVARNKIEEKYWPIVKGKVFNEATEIFLRLLKGETLNSNDTQKQSITRADCRDDKTWADIQSDLKGDVWSLPKRWEFENTKIIPQDWRRDLLQLIIGSHDVNAQEFANTILPTQVFNLSITNAEVIEATHLRMQKKYMGGGWQRHFMPRTTFVFINADDGAKAKEEAKQALGAYWQAIEGTLDSRKIENAANNALIGNAEDIAEQINEKFHRDDRLMLWFDFFNHDNRRVMKNMVDFKTKVVPIIEKLHNE